MSGEEATDVDDFFDQPINKKAAAKRRPLPASPLPDNANLDHHRDFSETSSDHSTDEIQRTPVDEESTDQTTSSSKVKYAAVIPTPSAIHHQNDQSDDSDTAEENVVTESVEDRPPRSEEIRKKADCKPETKTASSDRHNSRNRQSKNGTYCSKNGHSSDEEKRHLETNSFSRRPVSSRPASSCQQLGMYRPKLQRATSAPVRRPQWRPVSAGFSGGSRMDMKELFESLLHSETSHPRQRSLADPCECRRKRNYTFSDERLEMIERENRRLLGKMVTIQNSEPTYRRAREIGLRATPAAVRPTPFPDSARIKQLEKIQRENTELLRRLQTTQPSRDISRDALLADYRRNRAYLDRGCYCVVPQGRRSPRRRRANSESRAHHSGHYNC